MDWFLDRLTFWKLPIFSGNASDSVLPQLTCELVLLCSSNHGAQNNSAKKFKVQTLNVKSDSKILTNPLTSFPTAFSSSARHRVAHAALSRAPSPIPSSPSPECARSGRRLAMVRGKDVLSRTFQSWSRTCPMALTVSSCLRLTRWGTMVMWCLLGCHGNESRERKREHSSDEGY